MNRDTGGTMSGDAAASGQGDSSRGLADRLRDRTRPLHARAERSGIVQAMLQGRADRHGYALLIRNLLPAYQQMESGLGRRRDSPGLRWMYRPELFRARAIERDLAAICGPAWSQALALLPAGDAYAGRAAAAADGDDGRLIAHAYTRYLGDLGGGRVLKRLLARTPGLSPQMLSFYDFPDIADLDAFRSEYRGALDRAGGEIGRVEGILDEAEAAFDHNIEISVAVLQAVCGRERAVPTPACCAPPASRNAV